MRTCQNGQATTLLSRETYAKHRVGAKAFRPLSLTLALPNLWLLRAIRGACNPNLQVVITHACMYVASIRLDFL